MHAATLLQPLKTKHCCVVGAEPIIFNRGRSVASWTLHGYAVAYFPTK